MKIPVRVFTQTLRLRFQFNIYFQRMRLEAHIKPLVLAQVVSRRTSQRSGFNSRPVLMEFMVDKLELE
jgi:hypothetical protein